MRLALRLGRTLRELLDSISSEELTLWLAFDAKEPIGDWRNDLGFGVVASTIANANRSRNAPAFLPSDFMPLVPKKEEKLVDQIRKFLKPLSQKMKSKR